MAIRWKYESGSGRRFLLLHLKANQAETPFSVSKLIVWPVVDSIAFSHTSLTQSQWWYRYVQGEYSHSTSFWWLSFERVRNIVSGWSGTTYRDYSMKTPSVAVRWSAILVVSVPAQGLKHANTCCVDSFCWDIKLVQCWAQNLDCYPVSFLGQFVDIDWVGDFPRHSAQEWISNNVPPIFWHTNVPQPTLVPVASIDWGPIPLLHLGVA